MLTNLQKEKLHGLSRGYPEATLRLPHSLSKASPKFKSHSRTLSSRSNLDDGVETSPDNAPEPGEAKKDRRRAARLIILNTPIEFHGQSSIVRIVLK